MARHDRFLDGSALGESSDETTSDDISVSATVAVLGLFSWCDFNVRELGPALVVGVSLYDGDAVISASYDHPGDNIWLLSAMVE